MASAFVSALIFSLASYWGYALRAWRLQRMTTNEACGTSRRTARPTFQLNVRPRPTGLLDLIQSASGTSVLTTIDGTGHDRAEEGSLRDGTSWMVPDSASLSV